MLVSFKPHSEEFVHGYLGRLRSANLVSNNLQLFDLICTESKGHENSKLERFPVEILADLAGIQLMEFCRQHTLIPFMRAATNRDAHLPHGASEDKKTLKVFGLRTAADDAVFCNDCRIEQELQYGYSYWQRDLQVPGICRCPKHGSMLTGVPHGDFSYSPTASLSTGQPIISEESCTHDVIRRYEAIALAMLTLPEPMESREGAHKLGRKALALGFRIGVDGKKATISDWAREFLPKDWMRKFIPDLLETAGNAKGGVLHTATILTATPLPAALALALMFDDPIEAIKYWKTPHPEFSLTPRSQKKYGDDYWSSKEMYEQYVVSKGNHREISHAIGTEQKLIKLHLRKAGLPALGKINLEKIAPTILEFFAGKSLSTIAAMDRDEMSLIEDLLRVAGAKFGRALIEILGQTPPPVAEAENY